MYFTSVMVCVSLSNPFDFRWEIKSIFTISCNVEHVSEI